MRRLSLEIYVPWVFQMIGRGMLVPVVPLYLRDAGLSYTLVSVVLAATGLGAVLGGLPAGALARRVGPELLFVAATVVSAIAAALLGISTAVFALAAFRLAAGVGASGVRIAAQMLVKAAAPAHLRGRGMSMLGGGVRIAMFVGPLIGGLSVDLAGFTFTFVLCGVVTLIGLIPFFVTRAETPSGSRFERPAAPASSLRQALASHLGLLALAGVGTAMVMTVRAGRSVVVPLIGDDLGLNATAVGALVAIGTGADLVLFPVAGWSMDRYGRLAAIVPAFCLLGVGMLVLGLVPTTGGAIAGGVIMGVGNGMGSGTMLTVGADLAPSDSGPFLAALGSLQDLGVVIGPIVVGWLADTAGLYESAIVLGFVMFVAVAWIVVALGDTARPTRPWLVARLERSTLESQHGERGIATSS